MDGSGDVTPGDDGDDDGGDDGGGCPAPSTGNNFEEAPGPLDPDPCPPDQSIPSYLLMVTSDCYQVPANGGPVTRDIMYHLYYEDADTDPDSPYPTNQGVIWEHLSSGSVSVTGADSPSSGPPGTYEDTQSVLLGSAASFTQSFYAVLNSGTTVGLAVDAFGGWYYQLNITKTAGYVSINGNVGGKLRNGKLVQGSYQPCP
jgi:hypothetical protein